MLAELEAGRPALEVARVELLLGRILEVRLADDEAVGRKLREIAAEDVVEVEALALPLGAQALPGERRVALALHDGGAPGRPAGIDVFDLGDVDARRLQHRVGDRLPAGAAEHDGLALEALDVGRRLALAEGEVEHVGAAHVEDRDQRNALRQRRARTRPARDSRYRPGSGRPASPWRSRPTARAPASSRCRRNSRTSCRPSRDSRRAPRWCRAATPSGPSRRRARVRAAEAAERRHRYAGRGQRQQPAAVDHHAMPISVVSLIVASSPAPSLHGRPLAHRLTPPSWPISCRARRRTRRSICR